MTRPIQDCIECSCVPLSVIIVRSVETTLHVMRDCPLAMVVWVSTVWASHGETFFNSDLYQWIDLNMSMAMEEGEKSDWMSFWETACYSSWFGRNKLVHYVMMILLLGPWICVLSLRLRGEFIIMFSMVNNNSMTVIEEIRWLPQNIGWICLNMVLLSGAW
jgi:hypothetical protein